MPNIGEIGEKLAKKYLETHGYRIIGTNLRVSHLEIDILAKIKDIFVFVEVKTLKTGSDYLPEDNFSRDKKKKLKIAIINYCEKIKIDPDNTRLDLLAISLNYRTRMANIKHYIDIY